MLEQWNINDTGGLAISALKPGGNLHPVEEELMEMLEWPTNEFQSGWDSCFKNKPDKPVMHYSVIAG